MDVVLALLALRDIDSGRHQMRDLAFRVVERRDLKVDRHALIVLHGDDRVITHDLTFGGVGDCGLHTVRDIGRP